MTEPSTRREVLEYQDHGALAAAAADLLVETVKYAIDARGMATVALSGGSTPKAMYRVLSAPEYGNRVDWEKVRIFFSDERFVPPDSEESNFHTAQVGLFAVADIPAGNIHPVPTVDVTPDEGSQQYEQSIRSLVPADAEIPAFDLIFLGMGSDGHTASLFPDTEALTVYDRLVAPNFVAKLDTWRITFTYPLIDAARIVAFLVSGADKAERVREALNGANYPSARVNPKPGRLLWMVDAAALAEWKST